MSGTYLDRLFLLSAPAYRHDLSEGHRPNSMVCRRNGGHTNSRAACAGVTRGGWCARSYPAPSYCISPGAGISSVPRLGSIVQPPGPLPALRLHRTPIPSLPYRYCPTRCFCHPCLSVPVLPNLDRLHQRRPLSSAARGGGKSLLVHVGSWTDPFTPSPEGRRPPCPDFHCVVQHLRPLSCRPLARSSLRPATPAAALRYRSCRVVCTYLTEKRLAGAGAGVA